MDNHAGGLYQLKKFDWTNSFKFSHPGALQLDFVLSASPGSSWLSLHCIQNKRRENLNQK